MKIKNLTEIRMGKEVQEKKKIELLEEIFIWFINHDKLPERDEFRLEHSDDLDILDEMERDNVIQNRNGRYEIFLSEIRKLKPWDKEKEIAERVRKKLKEFYKENRKIYRTITDILNAFKEEPGMDTKKIKRGLYYLYQAGFLGGSIDSSTQEYHSILPLENVIRYTIDQKLERDEKIRQQNSNNWMQKVKEGVRKQQMNDKLINTDMENHLWLEVQKEYGKSKKKFGEQILFVKDKFKRKIIFRDVAHAYGCLKQGYYKSAVILAGGVIEELLRLYLNYKGVKPEKNKFDAYIKACEEHKLLKGNITKLSDVVRDFRNLIHLEREESTRHTISKSTALGAVSAIFTIANDFQFNKKMTLSELARDRLIKEMG